jgi:flagellar hook-associated protein 1 FlgK
VSDLFTSLKSASRSLDAQRFGMDVTGQNIANVNTPGYMRRTIDIAEVGSPDVRSGGGGAEVVGVRALRDRMLDLRLRQELPQERRSAAMSDALSVVEASLGKPGESLDAQMTSFFDAFAKLADNPTSAVARQEVLLQSNALTTGFHDMSTRLTGAQRDADQQVRSLVDQVNTIAGRIASLNASTAQAAANGNMPAVQDEQLLLVRQLSELANVQVIENSNGTMDVSIGNGRPLVVADQTYKLAITSPGPPGLAQVNAADGSNITGELTGGRIAGYLHVRDVDVPNYQSQLDAIAYGLVQQVNALHATGFDQSGAAGGSFFTPLGSSAGAAGAIAVAAGVAADPTKIAAAGIAEAGDNQMARSIASLRDATVLGGGTATFNDAWGTLVYTVGRDVKAASDDQSSRAQIVRQVDTLRDQLSGVSLDEEAANLLKFQRAYEANAKFFKACDDAITTLMQNLS